MDLNFEKNCILNVVSYIFAKNKVKIPRLLMEIMNESSCSKVYLFPSEVHYAVDVIIRAQEKVFKFLTKESIDFYYKRRIYSEKVFLEFITFHSRLSLLDTFDNPEAATEAYNSMMVFMEDAKQRRDFTFDQNKLILESKKIADQGLQKYMNCLVDECNKIHGEATKIVSDKPREAYFVTDFEKVKTKVVIGDQTNESETLDKEKINELKNNDKVLAEGGNNTPTREISETQSSKPGKCIASSAKHSEFIDVDLNQEIGDKISSEKNRNMKGLAEIVTTEEIETVVSGDNEDLLVKELSEAMEDIDF